VFHGLLSFCYTPQGYCEVGIFTASAVHKLSIAIIQGECPTGTIIDQFPGSDLMPGATFNLDILNGTTGVTSYQTAEFDLRDFKLLQDIEGANFFDVDETAQVPKRSGFYTQRLLVKKGVFYTLDTTFSTFIRNENGANPLVLGNIAYYVGANIKFGSSDESAVLRLLRRNGDPIERQYRQSDGLREIHIFNSCDPASGACDQIDFNLHFQSLRDPGDRERFVLARARGIDLGHFCDQVGMLLTSLKASTDPAPCAAAGFGSSPGNGG
jgi:hypothetical protein